MDSIHIWEAEKSKEIAVLLRKWYLNSHRKLPWRDNPSLYKTVVSEFMLQQTQVDTVLPYFKQWIENFPDFNTLANASEENVLKYWEGLGYYSRARNLYTLAKQIQNLSFIPNTPDQWKQFKGIGDYTSAAITSIAFGYPQAVVDGNVIRILTRLVADYHFYKSNALAAKAMQKIADSLLDKEDPGTHNQAVMELGATVCFKNKPLCTICPLVKHCKAAQLGNPEVYPKLFRRQQEQVSIQRVWMVHDNKILLFKNPPNAKRLANIWEIPKLELINNTFVDKNKIFQKKRGISNQMILEEFFAIKYSKSIKKIIDINNTLSWINLKEVHTLTLSGPHKKWLKEIQKKATDL